MKPTYANGWYQIAFSEEMQSGQLLTFHYFGRELVGYRGDDQQVRVFDAYCPHMGAHVGKGGKVDGNSVSCPFHKWKFDGEGKCSEISYAKKIPPLARLQMYRVCEKNGMVWIYFHNEKRSPLREVEPQQEFSTGDWSRFKILRWKFRSDTEHVIENIPDLAHFKFVHQMFAIPDWQIEQTPECFHLSLTAKTQLLGKRFYPSSIDVRILEPGYLVVRIQQTLNLMIHATVTPINEQMVEQRFAVSIKKNINPLFRMMLTPLFLYAIRKQFYQDIVIFENRKPPERPYLCDGDGPIGRYRRWYSQFYAPERSLQQSLPVDAFDESSS